MKGNSVAQPVSGVVQADPVERLASLFDTHYQRVYRLARRLSPNIDDALDLVQETFLKAARSVNSIPLDRSGEEAWLVRILINIQRDHWRKASVRERHKNLERGPGYIAVAGPESQASLIARTMIWQALGRLPPRRRAIVIMYELEGLSIPAIASLLHIRAVTVRWHLSMGRRDLNLALKPHMGDTDEKP